MSRVEENKILAAASDNEFEFRWLMRSDYDHDFFKTLSGLTVVGDVTRENFEKHYDLMFPRRDDIYKIIVVIDRRNGKIIGAGTLVIELKFIRNLGICGHIEDIVVQSGFRGKQLGFRIIDTLKKLSVVNSCYKVILDCD